MWEARKYGGWRNKGTRLGDFGMVEYCQLVKRCFLTEGQDVGGKIRIDRTLCIYQSGHRNEVK